MAKFNVEEFVAEHVVDADTIRDSGGGSHRLLGFDAPETGTPAGEEATSQVEEIIRRHGIKVKPTGDKGYYGRSLASAEFADDGFDVGEYLVQHGYARPQLGGENTEGVMRAESQYNVNTVLGLTPRRADRRTVDLSGDTATQVVPNANDVFTNAVGRGVDNLQTLIYSSGNVAAMALGDLFGTDVLDEWGLEGLENNMIEAAINPAQISEFDDVDSLADLYTYTIEALGEQAPNIASFLATGGIGGAAKVGVTQVMKASIAKKLHQLALKQGGLITKKQRAELLKKMPKNTKKDFARGQTAGVAGAAYGMGVGEIGQELREAGIDSPLTALVGAVPFAALDTVGFQSTIGRVFKGIDRSVATQSVKEIAGSIFRAAGLGAAAESSTEMLQEVITLSSRAYHDPTFEVFSDENLHRIREAGIKAGIVGGVGGAAATGINKIGGKLFTPEQQAEIDVLKTELAKLQEQKEAPDTPPDGGGPPSPPAGEPTTFPQRESNFGYVPPDAVIDAKEVYEDAPDGVIIPVKKLLEEEIEPALLANESKINAYEALRVCLAR